MTGTKIPVLELSETKLAYWREEIRKSRQKRKDISEKWDWEGSLKRYEPSPRKVEQGVVVEDINTQIDFSDVERKKAALIFDTPDVSLTTTIKGRESVVLLHQRLLNALLGPQHADVKPTVLEAVFNCLCPAGVGPVLVGYHCTKQPIDAPVLDPLTQQPVLKENGKPLTQKIDVPIAEKFFVSGNSPKALLVPAELRSTQFQKHAAWMGIEWQKPLSQVKREYPVPKDWAPTSGSDGDKPYFHSEMPEDATGDPMVSGVSLWYRAELDMPDDAVAHPDRLRELVLADGADKPFVHRDCEYQTQITEGPEAGRLSPDSMLGFPVRPLVLRHLSDSAWVPSDCAMTAQLTKEQNKYRRLALEKRDANVKSMVTLFDASAMAPGVTDKIMAGKAGNWVPLEAGQLARGVDAIMAQVARVDQGRETYLDQDLIARDRGKVLGMEDNQSGQRNRKSTTATEASIVQRNTEARFQQESMEVFEWYLDVARAFDTLILRYCDQRMATSILGPEDGAVWFQAKTQGALAGIYTYAIKMDSGKYIDAESERAFWMTVYNQTAKDPNVRRTETLKKIAPLMGLDPNTWIVEQLPDPGPPPPKMSIAVATTSLNPSMPEFPLTIELLRLAGYSLSPEAIQLAQTQAKALSESGRDPTTGAVLNEPIETMIASGTQMPVSGASADPKQQKQPPQHGGAQPSGEVVNKHAADTTGARPGPRVM